MNIIFFIHLVFFITMLVVPFMKNKKNLEFYSLLVPFIFYHWSVNDDTCALTKMEIMVPIYKMDDTDANNFLKTLLFILWMLVQFRLGRIDLSKFSNKK